MMKSLSVATYKNTYTFSFDKEKCAKKKKKKRKTKAEGFQKVYFIFIVFDFYQ